MTQTTTEVEAVPETAPAPPVEKAPAPVTEPTATAVGHTPGGWPVVPLAMSGANSTVGMIAASALAGGPIAAAAVAATGAAVLGTAAALRATRNARTRTNTGASTAREKQRAGRGTGSPSGSMNRAGRSGTGAGGRIPTQNRTTGAKTTGSSGSGSRGLLKSTGLRSGSTSAPGSTGAGKGRSGTPAAHRGSSTYGSGSGLGSERAAAGGSGPGSRVGQVRALRKDRAGSGGTRGAARTQTTADRRAVADARRAAKANARSTRGTGKGAIGRSVSRGMAAAGRMRRAGVDRARAARDRRTEQRVNGTRSALRKAPSRRRARAALWRSAARLQGRRLLAALLAAPLGVLGMLTTPLGRRLGWDWLQHPGGRLYRRLIGRAKQEKTDRDREILARLAEEEAAADAAADGDTGEIGDRAERPDRLVPSTPAPHMEVIHVSGFRFEEAAAEMENAARSYEPDGAMEILAMIENLPQAMQSIANTFQILAERSDGEFPLEKEVALGFDDIHQVLMNAIAAADDLGPIFRHAHAADIARHEDPRNGTEAEKGWNV